MASGMTTPKATGLQRATSAAMMAMEDVAGSHPTSRVAQPDGSPGQRLDALRLICSYGDQLMEVAVQQCLDSGMTWTAIGSVLGTTRQAAHERYARRLRSRRLV